MANRVARHVSRLSLDTPSPPHSTRLSLSRLSRAFMGGEMRRWPGALKTPPYVTAKPEVTHRTLSIPPLSPASSSSSEKSTLRFLVLATDGSSPLSLPTSHPQKKTDPIARPNQVSG